MGKRPFWFWFFSVVTLLFVISVVYIESVSKALYDIYKYITDSIVALFVGFFFIKGKFIFRIVAKKLIILSFTGLGKRYLIEKVLTYHFKIHFFNHIKRDLFKLYEHIKDNFLHYSFSKKIVAFISMIGSLSMVAKFMGKLLAFKVLLAKIWSFLLALSIKVGSSVVYFFTDYLWGSWLAPLLDLLIFSWVLKLFEKIPWLKDSVIRFYEFLKFIISFIDKVFAFLFKEHIKSVFRWLLRKTKRWIYRFIGYKMPNAYNQLKEVRQYNPNIYQQLQNKRASKEKKQRVSIYQKLKKNKRIYKIS
jgi:hypothetical protein